MLKIVQFLLMSGSCLVALFLFMTVFSLILVLALAPSGSFATFLIVIIAFILLITSMMFAFSAYLIVRYGTNKTASFLSGALVFVMFGLISFGQLGMEMSQAEYSGTGQELLGRAVVAPVLLLASAVLLGLFFWECRKRARELSVAQPPVTLLKPR
jgi:lysylphosphatidylglycerol synthetase-like protein (DUF2156 family)